MAGRTDESLRLVDFTYGGRPFGVLDLEDGAYFTKLKNTLQVRPGQRTVSQARQPGRYGGSRAVGERVENAEVAWTCAVQGASVDEALSKAGDLLGKLADMSAAGRMVEFRARDATYPTFLEIRGPGVATPAYDADLLEQEQAFLIELAVPVEPVGREHRMDILDTFDVPGDAVLQYTNLVTNPSFELDNAGWAGSPYVNPVPITRQSTIALMGTWAGRIDTNGALGSEGVAHQMFRVFRAGVTYTARIRHRSQDSTAEPVSVVLGAGDAISDHTVQASAGAAGGAWVTQTLTWTPTVTRSSAYLAILKTNTNVRDLFIDGAEVYEGTAPAAYTDGDSDKARWTGAPHASTSELYDRSTLSDYTFDASNSGQVAIASGNLTIIGSAEPEAHHSARGYDYGDNQFVVGPFNYGAAASTPLVGGYVKRQANGDRLRIMHIQGSGFFVQKHLGAGDTTLVTQGGGAATLAANTDFYLVGRIEGNVVYSEIWTSPPTPAGTATHTLTPFTLSAADAALFGRDVKGKTGWYGRNGGNAGYYIGGFRAEPFTYKGRTLPEVVPLGGAIPGDAPALVDVDVTHSGGSAAPAWALLGWSERPSIFNQVWNGDFEDDTNGWLVSSQFGFNAATSITRVTTAAKFGTASGEVVTTAGSAQQAAHFRLFGRFRKGVTYTFEAWVRSAANTNNVDLTGIYDDAGTDAATSAVVALATGWQKLTVTSTPTADRTVLRLGVRTTTATASTFQVDGVKVYEGTSAPTISSQDEGRGGLVPFGIIPAEACDTGDLSGWAITADANYRHGFGLKVTASGAGTAAAQWFIDPALLAADDFTLSELDIEIFAKVDLASTLVSPKLTLSARPEAGTSFGAERFAPPFGSSGKLLTKPSSGSAFRTARLGTLTVLCDPNRPQRWKLRVAGSWAGGSSGNFGLDELYAVAAARRAAGPTGRANDASYPKFVASTSETTKTIRADLSGLTAKPPNSPFPDSGLGGEPLEFPPGNVDVLVKLASTVPDDPTADTTSEQKEHTGTVHFAVTPRVRLLRGS